MSVRLSEKQITALCRFNRNFAVIELTMTEHPGNNDWITVVSTLKAGNNTNEKSFVLNSNGELVKNANYTANA